MRNDVCAQIHTEKMCAELSKCHDCGIIKPLYRIHICGDNAKYCSNCKQAVELDHRCYIQCEPVTRLREPKFGGYIFFDFEAYEDAQTGCHVVNLAIAQHICPRCVDILDASKRCANCKVLHRFYSIDEYCKWAMRQRNTIHIAHNLKGYDGVFIIHHLMKNKSPRHNPPSALAVGTKLLSIQFRDIKIIDSFSFMPMALASFTDAFGISELKKGFFPHLFNKPENANYVGAYPAVEY